MLFISCCGLLYFVVVNALMGGGCPDPGGFTGAFYEAFCLPFQGLARAGDIALEFGNHKLLLGHNGFDHIPNGDDAY